VLKQTQSLVSGSWSNRFTQTSEFDDAAWAKARTGVFPNVMESPLGSDVSADKLCENNASGTHTIGQTVSVTSGTTYRVSVYVRASERNQAAISFPSTGFTAATAVFDIAEGASVVSSTCQNAGIDYMLEEGWYRMWAEQTATSTTSAAITIGSALNGAASYTGTGHSTPKSSDPGIYLWGAELLDVSTPVAVTTNYDTNGYNANGTPKQIQTLAVALGSGQSPNLAASQVYDDFGNLTSKTDTNGQTTETDTYDLAGGLLTSTGAVFKATSSQTQTQMVKHNTYDAWGHLTESYATSTGDAGGTKANWTQATYDKTGRASEVKNVLTNGSTASTIDYFYDGLGRLIYQKDSTITGTSGTEKLPALIAYDAGGDVVASWAAGACTGDPAALSGYLLVNATRHIKTSDNSPDYDAVGRVGSTRSPDADASHTANATTYTYYDDGRVKKTTNPDGSWTRSYYDANGNVIHTLDSVMQAAHSGQSEDNPTYYLTTGVYDYANRLTSQTDGNNLTTNYTYDLLGRQTTAGAQGQSSSQYTYNALGWQLQIQDADGFTTSRIFDQVGRLTSQTSASYTTTYTYQSLTGGGVGLLSQKTEGSTDRQATYTYDYFGRANGDTETAGGTTVKSATVAYDSLGRVSTSTDNTRNLSHSFTYPQNAVGNTTDAQGVGASGSDLVSTTLTVGPDGLEVSRASTITSSPQVPNVTRSITTRDSAKRVTKATLQTDTSQYVYSQYGFDSAGRIIKQWGQDSGAGSGYLSGASSTTAYTYDATSGLKTADNLQLQSVGTAGVITGSYSYTTNGRLNTATTNGSTETDTFDAAGNLTSIGTGTSLTYDTNRLSTMTAGGSTTYYFFDSAKRWRTVQAPTNNQSDPNRTTFAYTGTGRLSTYTKYASGTASVTGTYTYDAQGQRTKSVVTQGGLTTTTNFNYEGLALMSLCASRSDSASWKITYLYDENGKPYAGVYRNPGTSTAPVFFGMVTTDRGDVVELLDAAGNPFAAYRYDAWGNPQGTGNVGTGIWSQGTSLIGSSVATDIANRQVLRYAGYCYDTESGLYYLSARSYDPKTRQFLSKDLSRNDGEQSAYQYCGGNPVKYIDPTGLQTADEADYWAVYAMSWQLAYANTGKPGADAELKKIHARINVVKQRMRRREVDNQPWNASSAPLATGAKIGLDGSDPVYMTARDWRALGYYTLRVGAYAIPAIITISSGGTLTWAALSLSALANYWMNVEADHIGKPGTTDHTIHWVQDGISTGVGIITGYAGGQAAEGIMATAAPAIRQAAGEFVGDVLGLGVERTIDPFEQLRYGGF
jgi:RHS repeat-associated protein